MPLCRVPLALFAAHGPLDAPAALAQATLERDAELFGDFRADLRDARSFALGGAGVLVPGSGEAPLVNPALVGPAGRGAGVQISTSAGGPTPFGADFRPGLRRFLREDSSVVTPGVSVRRGRWAAGYAYQRRDRGRVESTDVNGNTLGRRADYSDAHALAVAFDAALGLSVGVGAALTRERLTLPDVVLTEPLEAGFEAPGAHAFSFSVGARYAPALAVGPVALRPAVAASLTDLGPLASYGDDQRVTLERLNPDGTSTSARLRAPRYPQPPTARGGLSLGVATRRAWAGRPWASVAAYGAFTKRLVGGELRGGKNRYYGAGEGLVKTWGAYTDGDGRRVEAGEQIDRHAGIEASVLGVFTVRAGRHRAATFGRDASDYLLGPPGYDAAGIGLDLYSGALDYTWVTDDAGHLYHGARALRVTARVPFGRRDPANFWPALLGRR